MPLERIGLQLYSVWEDLARDFEGTLRLIAGLGFTQVEYFGGLGKGAAELRGWLKAAGLECGSAHWSMAEWLADPDARLDFAVQLGVRYFVCAMPWVRDPSKLRADPAAGPFGTVFAAIRALTRDDWKWNAEQLNLMGERARAAGIQLAYHNHNFEFRIFDGEPAYHLLLQWTDPELVKMELDCGWARVAGRDPAAWLAAHPSRFRLLHIRDFEPGFEPSTDLRMTAPDLLGPAVPAVVGSGVVRYPETLEAARRAGVETCFIERDPFFRPRPMMEMLADDLTALRRLLGVAPVLSTP